MDDFITNVQCDIELNVQGNDELQAQARTADLLRNIADRISKGEYTSDHHKVINDKGKEVGSIYVDYTEGNMFSDPDKQHH